MASELLAALFRRRQRLDTDAETFESMPEASTADASHLEDQLSFNAPSASEWLSNRRTPEEDRVADLLLEGLLARGLQPSHAPALFRQCPGTGQGDAERSLEDEVATALEDAQRRLSEENDRLWSLGQELSARESEVQAREQTSNNILTEISEKERALDIERQKYSSLSLLDGEEYPPPPWLQQLEGTSNIAVVGDSGVGKSLLINKLRRVEPGSDDWAPVGVSETTMEPTMYAFPGMPRVRLWDLPGAGTTAFPRESYIRTMGLRYFDSVLICSACRFTETEVALSREFEKYRVPYYMVRTKVDMDVWNNEQDNKLDETATVSHISRDLTSRGVERPYLVSSREPKKYEMPQLLRDVFPTLRDLQDTEDQGMWGDSWALPDAHSKLVSGVQGRWSNGHTVYLINGRSVHVTRSDGSCAVTDLAELQDCLWWSKHWHISGKEVTNAWQTGKLHWRPDSKSRQQITWTWQG